MVSRLIAWLKARLAPARHIPAAVSLHPWLAYADKARELGFAGPQMFFSFDCDTDLDMPAARELGAWLRKLGICATFAVPGIQLDRGAEVYAALHRAGFEFINHGALPHTAWDGEKYVGATFYAEMSLDQVEEDIRKGDALIRAITGDAPSGFRAPHFGCFQAPEQLDLLHRICASLGYTYSSSTIPAFGLERGPAFAAQGVVELPTLGSWRYPETLLDSWTYLADRVHYKLSDTYLELFEETLEQVLHGNIPVLMTWYADPCHVLDQPPFTRAMELVAKRGVPTLTGFDCACLFRDRLVSGRRERT